MRFPCDTRERRETQLSDSRRLLDLSHPIEHDMMTNPWMQKPTISAFLTREQSAAFTTDGVTFQMEVISLPGSTGTYLDSPFQFHADGPDVSAVPLERLFDVPIVVVRVPDTISIGREPFVAAGELTGAAVLVETGHSRHWGTGAFFQSSPYLTRDAVEYLIEANPAVVGIDSQNIDNGADKTKPAQHNLLGAGILILECMANLADVPDRGARLRVLPTPIREAGSFPVRPVAVVGA
ncbi:cyclase family protein [Actinokineospora sp. UTMC 2448]|uniref:cyclase family protein n=1 Tax=Actinokineospora sp. UTMC 2448 TaxID=2268449 RepID=UPI002164B491|nr:cyclase family protein [Actinokineospora sp. UTMC 2448]UVS78757.1 Kynurenine formamidase [Actinokineospora sp. UTMC 2448]